MKYFVPQIRCIAKANNAFMSLALIIALLLIAPPNKTFAQAKDFRQYKRAIEKEKVEDIDKLLNQGVSINCIDDDGNNPLMFAISSKNKTITNYLIQKGSNVNNVNKKGQSAIILATLDNDIALVKLLLDHGADIENSKTQSKFTPLGISIEKGHHEIYNFLISKNPNLQAGYLSMAITSNQDSIAWDLITKGVNIELQSQYGRNPLYYAIIHNKDSLSDYLIANTKSLETVDMTGKTLLNYSIESKNYHVFNILLLKTEINRRDYNGWSPLHYSIMLRDSLIFNKLLAYGANPNVYTFNDSISPLGLAALEEMDYFINPLFLHKAKIEIPYTSPSFIYCSAYLHWANAILNEKDNDTFVTEKAKALSDINLALDGFKLQVSSARWSKVGVYALNALSYASAAATASYQASTTGHGYATYTIKSTSDIQPGLDVSKRYVEKCKMLIQEIENYKN